MEYFQFHFKVKFAISSIPILAVLNEIEELIQIMLLEDSDGQTTSVLVVIRLLLSSPKWM